MTDDIQARIAQRMHRQEQHADPYGDKTRRRQHYESLARLVERRGDETVGEVEIVRDCVACGNSGYYQGPRLGDEPCPHCHGRGWLKAKEYEPRPLFEVKAMATRDGTRWGVMKVGAGLDEETWWHPERFRSVEAADAKRDLLLCLWCEGMETLLADNFGQLRDEEAHNV